MIELGAGEVKQVLEAYIVSNTPPYLYKRLRISPTVQKIAEERSPEELVDTIQEVEDNPERSAADVATAYAAAVALTLMDTRRVDEATADLRTINLRWINPILEIARKNRIETTASTFHLPKVQQSPGAASGTSTSDTIIIIPGD